MDKKVVIVTAAKGLGVLVCMAGGAILGKGFEDGSVKIFEAMKHVKK